MLVSLTIPKWLIEGILWGFLVDQQWLELESICAWCTHREWLNKMMLDSNHLYFVLQFRDDDRHINCVRVCHGRDVDNSRQQHRSS